MTSTEHIFTEHSSSVICGAMFYSIDDFVTLSKTFWTISALKQIQLRTFALVLDLQVLK